MEQILHRDWIHQKSDVSGYLNDDSCTFVYSDHGVVMDSSEFLQSRTVAPLHHSYTEAATQTDTQNPKAPR